MASGTQVTELGRVGGALAAALAVLALIACALAPAARAEPVTFGSGHLDWGVKQSFREYIESPIAHGAIDVFSGATRKGDGTFRFPVYAGSYDAESGEVRANGSVRFVGHDFGFGPTLELTISDPVMVIDGGESVLRADVVSRPMEGVEPGDPVTYTDVELAALGPAGLVPTPVADPGPGLGFGPVAATLTAAGAPAFGQYEPGVALDPVSATAFLGDPGEEPPDENPPPLPPSPPKPLPPPATLPVVAPPPAAAKKPKKKAKKKQAKRCRKGFRKVKGKGKAGKTRCVKKKSQKGKAAKRKAAQRKAAKRRGR